MVKNLKKMLKRGSVERRVTLTELGSIVKNNHGIVMHVLLIPTGKDLKAKTDHFEKT